MNKAEFINSVVKSGRYSTKAEATRAYDAVVAALSGRLSSGGAKQRVIRLPELLGPVLLFLPLLAIGWLKTSQKQRHGPIGLFLISALAMFMVYCLFPSKQIA